MEERPSPNSQTAAIGVASSSSGNPPLAHFPNLAAIIPAGTVLGKRYEIVNILGVGGMGAVYQARDLELDRTVALKVIRPELAQRPEVLQRFKQELLTASKVTHRNVIRIHDMSEADGLKFITMEFVAGRDLHGLLNDKGKFECDEALSLMRQVCQGLAAAHTEGVIHRDLKPSNIMLDASGRVVIMDFGLARLDAANAMTGMTQTGAMLGTFDYMSPEQAIGQHVDARSDLFTFGLILYELLTGNMPFKADSAVASLVKRTQERATPISDIDPSVPQWVSRVLEKCLERDPAHRYQTAAELLQDLENAQAPPISERRSEGPASIAQATPSKRKFPLRAAVAVLGVVLVLGSATWVWRGRLFPGRVPTNAVSVLVADFENRTGDPVFDNTLEPIFNVALEGASFVTTFSRGDARRVAAKLSQPSEKLDATTAPLVAASQGLGVVIFGTLDRQDSGYRVSLKAVRTVNGETIATTQAAASDKDQLLTALTKGAAAIRTALGDTTSESDQLFAMQSITATSLPAVHAYSLGVEAMTRGKNEDALREFTQATELDTNFGLAAAGRAMAARNLGHDQDAVTYIREAISHIDRMTLRERYRTRAIFYLLTHNYQKCVEEFDGLLAKYPADVLAHNNLGICWSRLRNMPKAMEEMRASSEILPKRIPYKFNLALYQVLASDFPGAEREAKAALELDPNYQKGYMILGLAQTGEGKVEDATQSYRTLEKFNPVYASVAAAALADLAAYQGHYAESARVLEQAAAADLQAKRLDRAADKFAPLAYVQLLRGQAGPAQAAAENALANSKEVKIRFLAARVFLETGATQKARDLAKDLAAEVAAEPQAYAKLVEGEIALKDGKAKDAITIFTAANELLDTWIGRFDLGRAYLAAGAFAEADSEFDRCLTRRGEALLVFMDDVPTSAYFPLVYYYQGRVREGLKSSNYGDSYRQYLSIRGQSQEDTLLAEARKKSSK